MLRLSVILLIASVALVSAASLKRGLIRPSNRLGRIAGGTPAELGHFPYQVALLTADNLHYCGGSIVNQRWVLTAGSCAIGKTTSDIVVFAGSNLLNEGGQRRRVDRIVLHPNFDVEVYANDVAVLRVAVPFIFSDTIQPIAMRGYFIEAGLPATASGFGRESISDVGLEDLRFVDVEVISQDDCREAFDENYTPRLADNTVCTTSPEGQGICLGDAGGPLTNDGELIGIISWGVPCGLGMPDVYARVSAHRAWILVHTMV